MSAKIPLDAAMALDLREKIDALNKSIDKHEILLRALDLYPWKLRRARETLIDLSCDLSRFLL